MSRLKLIMKWLLSLFLIAAGVMHFTNTAFYLSIMPPLIPWHPAMVYTSGVFEIVLGLTLLAPKLTRVSAWGIIALLIAVFPANLHMALHPELYPYISPTALWIRLPLQGVFIAWAYWFTRPEKA
ncbi:MAG: DoxX family membrane protein [Blastocatellia bacterium]